MLGTVAGLAALASADGADAGTGPECAYNGGTKQLTVTDDADFQVFVYVDSGEIVVDPGGVSCSGGTPTVTNVDHITVNDTGLAHDMDLGIGTPSDFAPGATDAGDVLFNPDEIEWTVDLGDGVDNLTYFANDDPARITYGTDGVNHNVSDNSFANDRDVELAGVDSYRFEGGNDDDGVSGAGTQGTGKPTKLPFDFYGLGAGIYGASGNDYLVGGRGDDLIKGSWNADYIAGGKGEDTADWDDATGPVTVDIGGASAVDGGMYDNSNISPFTARDTVAADIENLLGSDFDDVLRGDDDSNVLTGGLGADKLFGLGGNDLLKAKDSIADLTIKCGPGSKDKAKIDAGLDPKPKSC